MNRIVVTEHDNRYFILFLKGDKAEKIRAINSLDYYPDCVFLGRVKNIKDNIASSFVNYNNGSVGFINSTSRKPETVFPVMVKKRNSGNKEDTLTDNIILAGVYTIVGSNINGVRYSSRLNIEQKNTLGSLELKDVIFRTNAGFTDSDSIINEYEFLSGKLLRINEICNKRTDNSILDRGFPELIKILFSENIYEYDELLTDIDCVYEMYQDFIDDYKSRNINIGLTVRKYEDEKVNLKTLISFKSHLSNACDRKVFLKSDSYLVIDNTEAMTVIDVNSGNTRFKGNREEVIHSINMEAAEEVARQLKLRNLSGIIIVDFINCKNSKLNDELVSHMIKLLKHDDSNAKCHGLTRLGLMEISRDRRDLPLREQINKKF